VNIHCRQTRASQGFHRALVVLEAQLDLEPLVFKGPHGVLLEVAGRPVVTVTPHDKKIPPQLVTDKPINGDIVDPRWPAGEEHDGERRGEQRQEAGYLFDHGIFADASQERLPVRVGAAKIVVARRPVREDTVEIEDSGWPRMARWGTPRPQGSSPLLGDAPIARCLSVWRGYLAHEATIGTW
jgi:hypothetical protein